MIGEKFYKKYRITVIITSIITIIYGLFTNKGYGYELLPILPILFLIFFMLNKKIHYYSEKFYGLFILNILMFIRYVLSPFFVFLNMDYGKAIYTGVIPLASSCKLALVYMIIEMIAIFITILLFSDKFYNSNKKVNQNKSNTKNLKNSNKNIIIFLFIIFSIILILFNFNLFMPNQLLLINENYDISSQEELSGIADLVFFAFKLLAMGLLVGKCVEKYKIKNKFKYILFSYIILLFYIILNTSTSRINMILPLLFFILLTKDIFKKKGFILLMASVIVLSIAFVSITMYKNAWLFKDGNFSISSFSKILTSQIQEYTSNVRPIAQGIEATEIYNREMTLNTFFNDFIGSIPIINHFIDARDRSNAYYNRYILGSGREDTPLIMPLVTISAEYFSEYFCWVLTVVCILLMMYIDGNSTYENKTFLEKYIKIYLMFIFASCIYCNSQIIIGRLITKSLPIYFILFLNKKIEVKK